MSSVHSFHIPVMGVAFTVDTPLKVSQYGIDSVIPIGDDILLEKLRKMYCNKYKIPFQEIPSKSEDCRAKRITSYLNLIQILAESKFEELKSATVKKGQEIKDYFSQLPDGSSIKQEFQNLTANCIDLNKIKHWIKDNISMGSIDVNIMTKLDKANFNKKDQLPIEFNDAHAAVRGFANSNLTSSIILSAGFNPRLYAYLENFEDFKPKPDGTIIKKIVLKVSDYRSALIQGKFLAKKGIWVSEYRVESGLNCGGHAFPTNGFLLGPILKEFTEKHKELEETVHNLLNQALTSKNKPIQENILPLKYTVQGGVGTQEEHQFLLDHFKVDSVGWGTPFLLVPEVTNVDEVTMNKLLVAKENELYLSNVSPLGVPFNNLRNNAKELEKKQLVASGKPGSSCPKKFLISNNEFSKNYICTASRKYQSAKIKELNTKDLPTNEHDKAYNKIVEKECLCTGLGTSVLMLNDVDTKIEGTAVSVCPGPNMAYFSEKISLKKMIDHIYGRTNIIARTDRPNMFIKEMLLYIDFLKGKISEVETSVTAKQKKYLLSFTQNLEEGINYYYGMFDELKNVFQDKKASIIQELNQGKNALQKMLLEIESLTLV